MNTKTKEGLSGVGKAGKKKELLSHLSCYADTAFVKDLNGVLVAIAIFAQYRCLWYLFTREQ